MNYTKKDLGKNAHEFVVTLKKEDIAKQYASELENALKTVVVEGFRPGKAPKDLAEKQVDKEKVYEAVINSMLPKVVADIVKKEDLKPIVNPQIRLNTAKEGEDWSISVLIAEKPTIKLPDYKNIVKDIKADTQKADIWVPGKDKEIDPKKQEEQNSKLLNGVLEKLISQSEVGVADFIIESEVNRRMAGLIDDVRKLGLTLDSYLQSKGITNDQLKEQTKKEIEETYKLEMILDEVADREDITVTKEDTDKLLASFDDEAKRAEAEKNIYYYAMVLRRQKLVDFLTNL